MEKTIKFFNYFLILLLFVTASCTKRIYVPAQTLHKVEYKDSLIYIRDTIYIHLPLEHQTNKTFDDSSHLQTSVAKSAVWIDEDGALNHSLQNRTDTVFKYLYDTVVVTNTITEYKEVPIVQEVEVQKPYYPTWSIILMVIAGLSLGYWIYKIYGFFKIRLF